MIYRKIYLIILFMVRAVPKYFQIKYIGLSSEHFSIRLNSVNDPDNPSNFFTKREGTLLSPRMV